MRWGCKICAFSSPSQRTLITHYKLKHCHHASNCPLPCIYVDCVCSFRSELALKKHLARDHRQSAQVCIAASKLNCDLCNYSETCNITQYFGHLKTHLRNKETVRCPFKDCTFQSSVYGSFHAHRSKHHRLCTIENFRGDIHQTSTPGVSYSESPTFEEHLDLIDISASNYDVQYDEELQDLLQHKLASLLLRMQTVLHVSKATTQEIVNELSSICSIAEEFTPKVIESVLVKHNCTISSTVTAAVTEIVRKTNPLVSLSQNSPFRSEYRRATFYKNNFKVIEPVEYVLDASSKRTYVYVPILHVLSELLNRNDVLDKILQREDREDFVQLACYKTYRDGLCCKENQLLSSENLSIALGLYIDDFEICNPLGTSRKKHKVCAVYWVVSNLPIQYRSAVQSIYLACLCNSSDVKKYGYDAILQPLIKDLEVLEQQGLYVQKLGASVKGTVLYVSADNLGAHSLAGLQESFNVDKFCRFCLARRTDINIHETFSSITMLCRVIISQQDIRKLKLDSVPDTVDGFKLMLKSKLDLIDSFELQYEDEDFHDFCNLTCIADLPKEKVTLRVLFTPSTDTFSDSSLDTASLSLSSSTSSSAGSLSQSSSARSQLWPTCFSIPSFSFDVELKLRQANEVYRKDGVPLTISKDVKSEILDKLAEAMYSYKAYPENKEFESVAIALIEKHPCQKEPGSTSGWYGWKLSLKFKMGNYRQKLRDAGCQELKVNSDKRGPGDNRGRRNKVKKPRRSETNFLPDLPQGKDQKNLEEERDQIVQEMKKRNPDLAFVDTRMSSTYSLRRQEIVEDEPPVSELMVRWPALFNERQISMEFTRLVSVDLSKSFYGGLDGHLPKLLQLYRSKRFEGMTEMSAILESLDQDASNQRKRTAVLQALPWYLRENPSKFLKMCEPTDHEDDVIKGMTIGIVAVVEDVKNPLPTNYSDVVLVMEEHAVLRKLGDVPNAFMNLMGLLYVLNMNYPKDLKYTFEVIQRLFMGIGKESCTARVHTLKNKLLS